MKLPPVAESNHPMNLKLGRVRIGKEYEVLRGTAITSDATVAPLPFKVNE
jgi:hypothetical protein